jgi:hypothetical protein
MKHPKIIAAALLSGVLLAAIFTFVSCNKKVDAAKHAVEKFHKQLDSEQFASTYDESDDHFHHIATQENWVKTLQNIHQKLGTVQASACEDTKVEWSLGTSITLVCKTTFSNGVGDEKFVWFFIGNDPAALDGYRIGSSSL